MRIAVIATLLTASVASFGLAACSEQTQDDAQVLADKAAADTRDNLEVIENSVREGTIVAADKVSEGADDLKAELAEDELTDEQQGDGALDGTD